MDTLKKGFFPVVGALIVFASSGLAIQAAHPVAPKPHAAPASTKKAVVAKPVATSSKNENFQIVVPLELLKAPQDYLNKKVAFEGVFNNFSNVGLDYKKAFRDSKDYISFMIKRPDVTSHVIPLSELKLIYPRKKSEEVIHLETGDKVAIKGQVFSTALAEPWVDVSEIKILEKAKPKNPDCKEHC